MGTRTVNKKKPAPKKTRRRVSRSTEPTEATTPAPAPSPSKGTWRRLSPEMTADDLELAEKVERAERPLLWAAIDADRRAKETREPIDVAVGDLLEAISLFERRRRAGDEPASDVAATQFVAASRALRPYLATMRKGVIVEGDHPLGVRMRGRTTSLLDERFAGERRPRIDNDRDDDRCDEFCRRVGVVREIHLNGVWADKRISPGEIDTIVARSLVGAVGATNVHGPIAEDAHEVLRVELKTLRRKMATQRDYEIATLKACGAPRPSNVVRPSR